jgi:ribonuclease D
LGVSDAASIAASIAEAPLAAFDLEFLSAERLVPVLCLVQVSWLPASTRLDVPEAVIVATVPEVRLLDPLADDVRPVIEALAAHPLVIAHAPRQDLGLLYTRFGIAMPNVVDTQLMAAFAGVGDQVGLATLAQEMLGLSLAKEQQWTDWSRRPLSDAQLAYADADVRHLPALFARLRGRLADRLPWVRAESAQVAADAVAAASVTAETAWRSLGGLRGMDATSLAAAIALASWRFRTATELDRPLGQVLNEKVLIDLARQRPGNPGGIRGIKGASNLVKQRAEELLEIIAGADPTVVKDLMTSAGRSPSQRAQRWAEMLLSIVQLVSEQTGVAPRLLATRADAEEMARAVDEHGFEAAGKLPAMTTWRREVIGQLWIDWLAGKSAMAGDPLTPSGLALKKV